MTGGTFTRSFRRDVNTLEILLYILVSTAVVFYIDVITPLGLTIWILYFIPLFLTLYVSWRYAPFLVTGAFILLIALSFFLSPRDMSMTFALLNRIFFSGMLVVSAFFIWRYKRNVDTIRMSEERYRNLTEWSPDAIIVCAGGQILYTNPAGLHLLGAGSKDDLMGKEIIDLILPSERDQVRERMNLAMLGGRVQLPDARLARLDGREIRAETLFGGIIWDGRPAIQIILRAITDQ
jgi:PAS domain S-box-containing protein